MAQVQCGESSELLRSASANDGLYGTASDSADDKGLLWSMAVRKKRLGVPMTTFFLLIVLMTTITTPYVMKLTGLPGGLTVMILMGLMFSYLSTNLGRCWTTLQQRWPVKYDRARCPERRPYPAIALAAGGKLAERVIRIGILISCFGSGISLVLFAASTLNILIPHTLSTRNWVLIAAAVATPMVCLGAPVDSWIVAFIGGIASLTASVIVQVVLVVMASSDGSWRDAANITSPARSDDVTFESFWLGVSMMVFFFAGMTLMPSIHRDMKQPHRWPLAASCAYLIVSLFYIGTALAGYESFHADTPPHVSDALRCYGFGIIPTVTQVANGLLTATFIVQVAVTLIPITEDIEKGLGLSTKVNWQHIAVRLVSISVLGGVSAIFPSFERYVALVGASMLVLLNIIAPAWFYIKLHRETINRFELVLNIALIVLGVVMAGVGTYSSILGFIQHKSAKELC